MASKLENFSQLPTFTKTSLAVLGRALSSLEVPIMLRMALPGATTDRNGPGDRWRGLNSLVNIPKTMENVH